MISDKSFLGKLFVLLMLSVSLAAACEPYYTAYSTSLTGVKHNYAVTTNFRQCFCVKNIQTYSFNIACAGTVKFFSTTDCTGNYATSATGDMRWVNSFSMGANLGSSCAPTDCSGGGCP